MQRKIIYLINPIAGTQKKDRLAELIRKKTTERGWPFLISLTPKNGDFSELVSIAETGKYTDVCIVGGDGTINQAVNALAHLSLQFSIIPMGSGNGLANTARIPHDPQKALQLLFVGSARETDAFKVNGNLSCMLAGLGLDAQVANDFAKEKKRGLLTYIRLTLIDFWKAKSFPYELQNGKIKKGGRALMITISNSNQFGNQVRIAPQASICDGLLDVVIANNMSKIRFLLNATRQLLFGRVSDVYSSQKKEFLYFQTDRLTINNIGNAPFHIDGDPQPSPAFLEIEVLPGFFKLIHGRSPAYTTKGR
jgi:YegS/Rv2252/BmrU family lipid kinase